MRSTQFRDFRGVGKPAGALILGLAATMLACAGLGVVFDRLAPRDLEPSGGAIALAAAAVATGLVGAGLYFYGRRFASGSLTRREAVLSVVSIWLAAGVFGALPFVLGARVPPIDAFFESMSGLTTTGATVITDIDGELSRPLMLWRSLLQWLGGMGIVVLFVAVFPGVGAGGKHMFRGEVPGTTAEGLRPRIAETSITLWKIYLTLTLVLIATLWLLGVSTFDAICHALTTMSTGGFSTYDGSIGALDNPAVEYAISVFMLLAGINFGLYFAALRGRSPKVFVRSIELRTFLGLIAIATLIITLTTLPVHGGNPLEAFRHALFQVVTFATSTGYTTDDYMAYPSVAIAIIVFFMFVGGSAGSTAGGIKVERLVLMGKQSWAEIHHSFRPSVVRVVRMGRRAIDSSVLGDVAAMFVVYMGCMGAGVLFVSASDGVPLPTAFGAVLSCLSNMGPAPFHLGADNFASYSPLAKVFFALAMLLGRLEFFTLFALFVPDFWKR